MLLYLLLLVLLVCSAFRFTLAAGTTTHYGFLAVLCWRWNIEQAQQRNLAAAPQFGAMGAQQFGLQSSGLGALQQLGGLRRASEQEGLNELFRQAEDRRMQPYNRLSYFGDILAGIPSVSQTLTSKPAPYTNPILGGIGMGLGAYGMMNQSG